MQFVDTNTQNNCNVFEVNILIDCNIDITDLCTLGSIWARFHQV